MKLESYGISKPTKNCCKQYAIWGTEGSHTSPLIYLQRPKWIKDDKCWKKIIYSIQLNMPLGMEVE